MLPEREITAQRFEGGPFRYAGTGIGDQKDSGFSRLTDAEIDAPCRGYAVSRSR